METLGELTHTVSLSVQDQSHVAEARRTVASLLQYVDLSEADRGRVALILTELATNILKHAGTGDILIQSLSSTRDYVVSDGISEFEADLIGIDLIAIDTGPGMADPGACVQDGYSTAGSSGTGLGAISRKSDVFDIYSEVGKGSVVFARVIKEGSKRAEITSSKRFSVCGINVPYKNEIVSGDSWGCKLVSNGIAVLVADGIGHGEDAHKASKLAVEIFHARRISSPCDGLDEIHAGINATRGAAASLAMWDVGRETVQFCGIGNVSGSIVQPEKTKKLMTYNGTLGHNVGKYQDQNYPMPSGSVLVMHSDGLTTNWNLEKHPGLLSKSPSVIAAVLYRDHTRGRDDASVVVAKEV
jgi:anti-sigma regulatory factor (Ser/Thr protein kinase)